VLDVGINTEVVTN